MSRILFEYHSTPSNEAIASSQGTSTVTGVSGALSAAVGSSTGSAEGLGTLFYYLEGVGSSSGQSISTWLAEAAAISTGSSSGEAVVTGDSSYTVQSVFDATGQATVSGVSEALSETVGDSQGSASVSGVAAASIATIFEATGGATVTGEAGANAYSEASSSGTATVSGVGDFVILGVLGESVGQATVSGVAGATASSNAESSGAATVLGDSESHSETVFDSAGASSVTGLTEVYSFTTGEVQGLAEVTGIASSTSATVAESAGEATVSGFASSLSATTGSSTGGSATSGVGAATASSVGGSAGAATVNGVLVGIFETVAAALGQANVAGRSRWRTTKPPHRPKDPAFLESIPEPVEKWPPLNPEDLLQVSTVVVNLQHGNCEAVPQTDHILLTAPSARIGHYSAPFKMSFELWRYVEKALTQTFQAPPQGIPACSSYLRSLWAITNAPSPVHGKVRLASPSIVQVRPLDLTPDLPPVSKEALTRYLKIAFSLAQGTLIASPNPTGVTCTSQGRTLDLTYTEWAYVEKAMTLASGTTLAGWLKTGMAGFARAWEVPRLPGRTGTPIPYTELAPEQEIQWGFPKGVTKNPRDIALASAYVQLGLGVAIPTPTGVVVYAYRASPKPAHFGRFPLQITQTDWDLIRARAPDLETRTLSDLIEFYLTG